MADRGAALVTVGWRSSSSSRLPSLAEAWRRYAPFGPGPDRDQAIEMIAYKQDAIEWMKDPQRFPNGNFVGFANIYEFTDATGDVQSCDVSGLAGFEEPVPSPDELAEVVTWIEEEYMRMAVETGSDMIFLFEEFCGRGFNYDDPTAPCYRGPGEQRWFDLTCTHPNPTGHQAIANMFMAVVEE